MAKSILFLSKRSDERSRIAAEFLEAAGCSVQSHYGEWGDKFPIDALRWRGDIVVSYLSRWVVPQELLTASALAINFHPAPPEYPGIGGTNWALYEEAKTFGVTCHHMSARVDAGQIIAVRRFPTYPLDTVATISERAWSYQLVLFYEIMSLMVADAPLPQSSEVWSVRTRTRKEFEALRMIQLSSDADDAIKRIRATTYDPFYPVLRIGDLHLTVRGFGTSGSGSKS